MYGGKCNWHKLRHLSVILGLLFLCVVTLIAVYATGWKEESLKWQDDFDTLDDSKWYHIVTGNRGNEDQFQYYRRDKRNSYVKNGTLHLKATLVSNEVSDKEIRSGYQNFQGCNVEPCLVVANPDGDCLLPVYSARLHTKHPFEIRRGRIEVGARFPSGDWLRAEITLLPGENAYGKRATSGKISVADVCGNKNLTSPDGCSLGGGTLRQSLHPATNTFYYNENNKTCWETTLPSGYFSDEFHVFAVEWSDAHVAFRVDGRETGKVLFSGGSFWELGGFSINVPKILGGGTSAAPFDRPFHVALDLSVGGNFFDEELENYPKPWNLSSGHAIRDFYENEGYYAPTWDKPELEVDYIRVYEY